LFDLVGAFRKSKFKIPNSFKSAGKNNLKLRKNGNFYAKLVLNKMVFGATLK